MSDLSEKKCLACEGGLSIIDKKSAEKMMSQLHSDWALSKDATQLTRHITFKGFLKTMGFVNALAWMANQEMHHPDFSVTFNSCTVNFTTHAINGLSENDFICASKVDQLLG